LARLEWLGMEEVGFPPAKKAWNKGSWFWFDCRTWKGESQFWPDWNGLEWRKSVLARLEWLEMEKVGFSLIGIA
jgi:hypothetical protein